MDRLSVFEYGSQYYVGLVEEFFIKNKARGVKYGRFRSSCVAQSYLSFSNGDASGAKPRVWAAAMIRIHVLEKSPHPRLRMDNLADLYGVTDVAVRNTAQRIKKSEHSE